MIVQGIEPPENVMFLENMDTLYVVHLLVWPISKPNSCWKPDKSNQIGRFVVCFMFPQRLAAPFWAPVEADLLS